MPASHLIPYSPLMARRATPDGGRLRQLRQQRGLSARDLAAAVNIPAKTLWNIEGGATCSWERLYRIAGALDVPIQHLLTNPEQVSA